jgi:hypothetical protein
MADRDIVVREWLTKLPQASQNEKKRWKEVDDSSFPTLYVDENTIKDMGTSIFFHGAETAGEVCAGFITQGFGIYKNEIISKGATQYCSTTKRPYFRLTYRPVGVPPVIETGQFFISDNSEQFTELMRNVPSVTHGGSWPYNHGYVSYATLRRVPGNYFIGRFARTLAELKIEGRPPPPFTTMPDEKSWETPIRGFRIGDNYQLVLHAILISPTD